MSVAVYVDLGVTGHHSEYLAALARYRPPRSSAIFVVPHRTYAFAMELEPSVRELNVVPLSSGKKGPSLGVYPNVDDIISAVQRAVGTDRVERLFLACLDHWIPMGLRSLCRQVPGAAVVGLLFRFRLPYLCEALRQRRVKALIRDLSAIASLRSAKVECVYGFDDLIVDWLLQFTGIYAEVLAEPVKFRALQERPVDSMDSRTYFLLYGVLEHRKGVKEVMNALHMLCDEDRRRLHLTILGHGPLGGFVRQEAARWAARGVEISAVLGKYGEEQLHRALERADFVLAPYIGHFNSSGVVLSALAGGRPVVGAGYGWIGRTLRATGAGIPLAEITARGLATAFKEAMRKRAEYLERARRARRALHAKLGEAVFAAQVWRALGHQVGAGRDQKGTGVLK